MLMLGWRWRWPPWSDSASPSPRSRARARPMCWPMGWVWLVRPCCWRVAAGRWRSWVPRCWCRWPITGPTNLPVLVAVYTAAAAGRLLLALLAGGAFTGAGVAYRSLVEGDPLGVEAVSAAALLPAVALLGDAAYRRRSTAGQADAVVSR